MAGKKDFWKLMEVEEYRSVFAKKVYDSVISNLKDAFGYCCRNNLTLAEYLPKERFGNQPGQITIFITVRMSELWENAIYEGIRELLGEIEIDIDHVKRWTDADGDIKVFDQLWEIKTSQATNSWTGATHSSHKVKRYILVNYTVDRKLQLKPTTSLLKGFVPELSIYLLDLSKMDNCHNPWKGEPKKNSSFTTMKILNEWVEAGCVKCIWGDIKTSNSPRRKNATIIRWDTRKLDNLGYESVAKVASNFKK